MSEARVEPHSPAVVRTDADGSPTVRQPFVPPTVKDLGGLTQLTQLGGTV